MEAQQDPILRVREHLLRSYDTVSKMEYAERKILFELNKIEKFDIESIVSTLDSRKLSCARSKNQLGRFLSNLIAKRPNEINNFFEIFVEALELTNYPKHLIKMMKEKREAAKISSMNMEKDILKFTNLSENIPFIFLDVMCKVAETLEETDISTISENFTDITQGEIEEVHRSERPQMAILILLQEKQIITHDSVEQLYRILKKKSSAKILLNYMSLLTRPEIKFTGILEPKNHFMKHHVSLDFEVYRKLNSFFEQRCHVVLCHIEKGIQFKAKVPTTEALNYLVQALESSEISTEVSSILGIHGAHFKLELARNNVESVRASLDKDRTTAVPLCLPDNCTWDDKTKKITVDKMNPRKILKICGNGADMLEEVGDKPVVVISIVGPARSGKSFLASQLLDGVSFELGHRATSHTTGIWIGVGPTAIPVGDDEARFVILDAEGLGGVTPDEGGVDSKWEHKIFSLCVLLSSFVIYNTQGVPDYSELDKLGFIAEFSSAIFNENHESANVSFSDFAPKFLWLIRDNLKNPEYKINGWTKFVNDYLLVPRQHENQKNKIRKSITSTFSKILATDLPPPTFDPKVVTNILADENRSIVNSEFIARLEEEKKNISSLAKVKVMRGSQVTGRQLHEILKQIMPAVNDEGDKLDVTNMWDNVVKSQMQHYTDRAIERYSREMGLAPIPMEEEEYYELHENCTKVEIQEFHSSTRRFEDTIRERQISIIKHEINSKFESLEVKNEMESFKFNSKLIAELEKKHLNDFKGSSCESLTSAEKDLINEYNQLSKGPKAKEVQQKTQLQREVTISTLRKGILEAAMKQSLELFHSALTSLSLEQNLANVNELCAYKEKHLQQSLNIFSKARCKYSNCTVCAAFSHELEQRLNHTYDKIEADLTHKSEVDCQDTIDSLIVENLQQNSMDMSSLQFSQCLKIKEEIILRYDKEAKGPAKDNYRKKCIQKIDSEIERIELLILHGAKKAAYDELSKTVKELEKREQNDAKQLSIALNEREQSVKRLFDEKCRGMKEFKVNHSRIELEIVIGIVRDVLTIVNHLKWFNHCVNEYYCELEKVKQQYPLDENELRGKISTACKNARSLLNDYKKKEMSFQSNDAIQSILSDIIEFDMVSFVSENFKQSIDQFERIGSEMLLKASKGCSELVPRNLAIGGTEAVTGDYEQVRLDCMDEFERLGNGVLKQYYRHKLESDIDKLILASHAGIADNNFKQLLRKFRSSAENILINGPCETEDLNEKLKKITHELNQETEGLYKSVKDCNFTLTEEMITSTADNVKCYIQNKNHRLSVESCNECRLNVLQMLHSKCKDLIEDQQDGFENPEKYFCHIKMTFFNDYYDKAIGPAKEIVAETLEVEIERKVDETRKLLKRNIFEKTIIKAASTFKTCCNRFNAKVTTCGEFDIDVLHQQLNESREAFVKSFPFEEELDKLSDALQKQCDGSFQSAKPILSMTFLLEGKRTYEKLIAEIQEHILGEAELQNRVAQARETFSQRFKQNFLREYPEVSLDLENFMSTLENLLPDDNHRRSRDHCENVLQDALNDIKRHKQGGMAGFRDWYEQVSKGPATEEIWSEHLPIIKESFKSRCVIL